MTIKIGCVVEGKSEITSVPILIRRVAAIHYPELATVIPPPTRISRNKVFKTSELERAVRFTSQNIGRQGAIFIILDSDDDCPAEHIVKRATNPRSQHFLTLNKRVKPIRLISAIETLFACLMNCET